MARMCGLTNPVELPRDVVVILLANMDRAAFPERVSDAGELLVGGRRRPTLYVVNASGIRVRTRFDLGDTPLTLTW